MTFTRHLAPIALSCALTIVVPSAAGAGQKPPAAKANAGSPFDTTAKVAVKAEGKALTLKREEQIAFMFVDAIKFLLDDCQRHGAEPCTVASLARGPKSKDKSTMGKLKFDPAATDPNYTYKLALNADGWEIEAVPTKPGLGGFYCKGRSFIGDTWYNPAGPATAANVKLTETSISGDMFLGR
jgi:hypothetical protein